MPSLNRVMLIGHLGRDPKSFGATGGVVKFSIATNESWKDKSGQWQKKTEWHNIVAFGRVAEQCALLGKGDCVYIDGKIQTSKYTGKDGLERKSTDIVAATVLKCEPILSSDMSHHVSTAASTEEYGPDPTTPREPGADDVPF